jgi:hypothetical protein
VLVGADVGLTEIGEQLWSIHFGSVRIGYLDGLTQRALNRRPERPETTPASDSTLAGES